MYSKVPPCTVRIAALFHLPCSTFANQAPEFQPKHLKMRKTQVVGSCIKPDLNDTDLKNPGQTERELYYFEKLLYF